MLSNIAIIFYYRPANKYSLIALSGVMESTPELSIIDLYYETSENHLLSRLNEIKKNYNKIIIATSLFSFQVSSTAKTIGKIKDLNYKNTFLIAGGPHATGNPEETLHLGFDAVVAGEGEVVFKTLVLDIISLGEIKPQKGVLLRKYDNIQLFEPQREYIDINQFLPLNKRYHKFAPIEITRGCPFGCTYCQTPRIFGHKVRHRSLDNILQCVEIMKSLKFRDVRFTTPNFFSWQTQKPGEVNIPELYKMFSEIKRIMPNGRQFIGSFPSEVRPENITLESIQLVKEFGSNDNLVIGAQTGSERMLKQIRRGHNINDVYNAVDLTVKAGFRANVDVIFGLPGETEDDQLQTVLMIDNLIEMGAYIHAHTFMPLIQTPLANEPVGTIGEIYKKMINRWIPTGKIYGQWEAQQFRS
jgi:B12-binding domain/radical SAM domain protein